MLQIPDSTAAPDATDSISWNGYVVEERAIRRFIATSKSIRLFDKKFQSRRIWVLGPLGPA